MATKMPAFTPVRACVHCGNRAPMEIVRQYSQVDAREATQRGQVVSVWEEGYVYELLECPACKKCILQRFHYHDHFDPGESEAEVLYPTLRIGPVGLPTTVERAYEAATKVQSIDANAFAVLLGRVLEIVCEDRSASGDTLYRRLEDLGKKGEIPEKLEHVAQGLRELRNVGAHPGLGELTGAEVPILDGLTRAILEYVYSAPLLAAQAEKRLEEVKSRRARGRADASP